MLFRKTINVVAAAVSVAAAGCGASGSTSPSANNPSGPSTSANAISVVDIAFSPATLNVAVGATVAWQWEQCNGGGYGGGGGACVSHNVTFDDGISSATQASGTFSRTFATPGTYKYHCSIHGAAMSGEIVVK